MQYEVGGIVFTFTQDDTGRVVNINSGNAVIVALIGSQGLTFQTGVPIATAKAIADALVQGLS
jgi:hypothetical protein